jgi:hypothetical protein
MRNSSESSIPPSIPRTTATDIVVVIAKGALGTIPGVGGIASEIVSAFIPKQRLDRIQDFLEVLAARVERLEESEVEESMKSEQAIDLLEDCLSQAARALSPERISYLASLYAKGIIEDQAEHEQNKKMVSLLGQLSDAEVIWLGHLAQNFASDSEIPKQHEGVLAFRTTHTDSSADDFDKEALQFAWVQRLEQLGLAKPPKKSPYGPNADEFDELWLRGLPEVTWLGRMLLDYIGIAEPLRSRIKRGNNVGLDRS